MSHITAPWFRSQRDNDLIYIHEENGKCIAMIPDKDTESSILNAQLIVEAPELLEALKGLLADIIEYQTINNLRGESNHWQVRAHAVIQKAEGK